MASEKTKKLREEAEATLKEPLSTFGGTKAALQESDDLRFLGLMALILDFIGFSPSERGELRQVVRERTLEVRAEIRKLMEKQKEEIERAKLGITTPDGRSSVEVVE